MKRYQWHTAIVTGGASGIGLEFCKQLVSTYRCRIIIIDRTPASAIANEPILADALYLQLDLCAQDAMDHVTTFLDANNITPDLLINNAGIFDFKAVADMTTARIDTYIDLHIRAMTMLSRTIALRMAQANGGAILNMSSMSCWMPMPGIAMYSATKAYIRVLSRAMRVELRDSNVSVTVACPGGIATDLFGLPKNLQKLGVKVGALTTPQRFVRNALRKTRNGRKQYINGLLNHISIVAVAMLPERLRLTVKHQLLDRLSRSKK
jgi:hypothetical protein